MTSTGNHNRERKGPARSARLTTRGRWLLVFSVALLLLSISASSAAMLRVSLFGLLLLALAPALCRINLDGVSCALLLPETVYSGEKFFVEIRVENEKTDFCARDIEVIDRITTQESETSVHFRYVGPYEGVTAVIPTQIRQRGVHNVCEVRLTSLFPMGLVSTEETVESGGRIVVCPRPAMSRSVEDFLRSAVGHGGVHCNVSEGVDGEFRSVREYRFGDHPRRISWPLTARLQRLVVREWEQPRPLAVSIVFHSYEPQRTVVSQKSFELSLCLLSGLFEYLHGQGTPFELRASFNDWRTVAAPVDPAARRDVQLLLATSEMRKTKDFAEIRDIVAAGDSPSVVQLVVSNTPRDHWEGLLTPLSNPVFCIDNAYGRVLQPRKRHMEA